MAHITIREVGVGQHPSEVMVEVKTESGMETLIVDRRSIVRNTLDVGFPIEQHHGHVLVELPRETMSGRWRVLVPEASLLKEEALP